MSTNARAPHDPLFDRLCGVDPAPFPPGPQDGYALRASLRRDLLRLLNTRNGLTIGQFMDAEGTVLHYGVPDLTALNPRSEADLQVLAEVVRLAVSRFEPRLAGVGVQARADTQDPSRARLSVSAAAAAGRAPGRLHFDIDLWGPGPLEVACA